MADAPLTEEQAATIAKILSSADGGCSYCAGELCEQMARAFPGHDWRRLADLDGET